MRTSLSCDSCRRSKIKCVNSGRPPCHRCSKSSISGCRLTRPAVGQQKRKRSHTALARLRLSGNQSRDEASLPVDQSRSQDQAAIVDSDVRQHITGLSKKAVLHSLTAFVRKAPELAFLHTPHFMASWGPSAPEETVVLLATILAVVKLHSSALEAPWLAELLDAGEYARYARGVLQRAPFLRPKIHVVQAMLVMTLHDWGNRSFHRSWVFCGMAMRVMQTLHGARVSPHLPTHVPLLDDDPSRAVETRTFWACFIMERMIHSGTYNPPMLPLAEMQRLKTQAPCHDIEFALGAHSFWSASNIEANPGRQSEIVQERTVFDAVRSFEILARGFDIWFDIMTSYFQDGRRAPGMCAPQNCPWESSSPWSLLRTRLEKWRTEQHQSLHYPGSNIAMHTMMGSPESFVYLNLLYYTSKIMLLREYFPFLPMQDTGPNGPRDPYLEAEAPPGWWVDSAHELFDAARWISTLVNEASEYGASLTTPFAGFCVFSACFMNIYVHYFPHMNLGRTTDAEALIGSNIAYLREFTHVWRLGDCWLKTIQNVSTLYKRANANRKQYEGKSRTHFRAIHSSVHEFRTIDRSRQQMHELEVAESQQEASQGDAFEGPRPNAPPMLFDYFIDVLEDFADEESTWSNDWALLDEGSLASLAGETIF